MIWRCDLVPQYNAYRGEIDEAIQRVLRSGRYILATEVAAFEQEFAAYLGVKHVVSVANGTDGLVLALRARDIGPGDEVITTPFTAIPTVSAIVQTGATPVFVDVCGDTFLMDVEKVASAVTPRTKAVIPVHIFGNMVDVPRLRQVVGDRIVIVEDACQSHGSTSGGRQSGSLGDMGVFSFYPTKNLGGYGDGGAVATNSDEDASLLRLLRTYGMTDYNHIVIDGENSRLDELQAAVLRVKLKHLDAMNEQRRGIAEQYVRELRPDLFRQQHIPPGVRPNYHVFASRCMVGRAGLMRHLAAHEIQTNIYYLMPVHLQEAHRHLGWKRGDLPVSEQVCGDIVALPMYPELPAATLTAIISAINSYEGL